MPPSADEALARIADDAARAQRRAERFAALQTAVGGIRGRAVSRERDLAVEVDSGGRIVALRIHDTALSRGGARLGSEILALVEASCDSAQDQVREAAVRLLGEDEPLLRSFPARPRRASTSALGTSGERQGREGLA
jgi:hypothetical protein